MALEIKLFNSLKLFSKSITLRENLIITLDNCIAP